MMARQATASGDPVAAAHWWSRLAQADPFNTQVAVQYIEALARTGDRAGGLRYARTFQARLREELDIAPDAALEAVVARLRTQSVPDASVCVLPFLNLSREDENDYFSDGMTEELTNALTQVPGLRVASRTSAFAFKGKNLDLREIGQRLGVRSVVEGSVRKEGNRLRVTAQLIDAISGFHSWSQVFERTLHDVFELQEEISRAITRALPLKVSDLADSSLVRAPTATVEAYMLYLRGRYFALRRTPHSLRLAIEYFEQAIQLDPEYAVAHAGIAECFTLLGFEEFGDTPPHQVLPRATAAVEQALMCDAHLAEGHNWRAVVAFLFEYDWPKAEASFLRAIELRPSYSLAHTWYGISLGAMGRGEEGLARLHHAEQLDPMAITIQAVLAHALYFVRRYDEALQRHLAVLELDPDNVRIHAWVARLRCTTGQFEHGLKALQAVMHRVGRPPILLAQLGSFHASLGCHPEAWQVIQELEDLARSQYVSRVAVAHVHRALGNQEEALRSLEEAFEERSGALPFLAVEPCWDSLRQHARFRALVSKLGLRPDPLGEAEPLDHSAVGSFTA
jgi:TolB-like protein/Tfp pilus assembly protein PilF